jgi:RNA polymerase sporulation-specific sigma factor
MTDESTAENSLVIRHTPLVVSQALLFHPNTVSDFDDLVQAGNMGLLFAIRQFDADQNVQFATFATTCIRHEILRECKKFNQKQHSNELMDCPDDPENDLWEFQPDSLGDDDRKVLLMRASGHTCEEIGYKFKKTRSWASLKLQEIFKHIREVNDK